MLQQLREHLVSEADVASVVDGLVEALNRGDVDQALARYQSEAVFYPEPGVRVDGLEAIGRALREMTSLGARITTLERRVVCQGDVALYQSRWQASVGGTPAPSAVSADVLRRCADGQWRIVIDNPWGEAGLQGAG